MALIEINKDPTRKELNWFGGIFALFFALLGALLRWQFNVPAAAMILWCAAGALTAVYYAAPSLRRPFYLAWMHLALPIGWLVSHVLLALVYYLVFTPIGLIMRLLGYDPMQRRFEPDRESYWVEHRPGSEPSRYFRQF